MESRNLLRVEERVKLFEKMENRDRGVFCVGGLIDVFYEWIYRERRFRSESRGEGGGVGKINVGKVRLIYFYRL